MSQTRIEALAKAQAYFRLGNLHMGQQEFRKKIFDDFGFYDGTTQWDVNDLAALNERNQRPITVNICKGFVDNLSGVEIQSRYRTAVRSDSFNPADDNLAEALTHLLFYVQEHEEVPYKGSLKFRDALICGVGWSHIYQEDDVVKYDYVNPYNIIADMDDLSPQFTNMKYICRKFWMSPDMVKSRWPNQMKDEEFGDIDNGFYGTISPEILDRNSTYTNYSGENNSSRILVVEVQYKVPAKIYSGLDTNGRSFETFNADLAEELAEKESDIETKIGQRIMRVLFCNDTLLEFSTLQNALPNQRDFSYVPLVFQRSFSTGVPYGLLQSLKDVQRDCNVRITKSVYLMNSSRIVIESGSMEAKEVEILRNELKQQDSVIIVPQDSKVQITSNAPLSESQIALVNMYLDLAQRAVGITNEQLGLQTNATSGIAQHVRQVNSVRNNVFAFDSLSSMKKREAYLILSLVKASGLTNMGVEILDDEKKEVIILNLVRKIGKKTVVLNDVRTLPVSLYIEEVPDYASSFAEEKATFEALLSNGSAPWMMTSPELLERVGIRNPKKLAEQLKVALSQQQAMKSGDSTPQASPTGVSAEGVPLDQLSPMMQIQRPM